MTDDHRFDIGELVEHKRYGYRGVVAGFDLRCRAGDDWYHGNLTQPSRDQPWYHVLVHGAEHTTYVAEDNLEPDAGGEQVVHPLARLLFQYFQSGQYVLREGVRFPDLPPADQTSDEASEWFF